MSGMKSLWASVQGDPVFMRRVNGWFTIFWIVMIPISIALGLLSSVVYVSALSLWALVSGHWSAWQAARVEVAQQIEAQKLEDDPIEQRVVDEVIRRTEISPAPESPAPAEGRDSLVVSAAEVMARLDALAGQLTELQARHDQLRVHDGLGRISGEASSPVRRHAQSVGNGA